MRTRPARRTTWTMAVTAALTAGLLISTPGTGRATGTNHVAGTGHTAVTGHITALSHTAGSPAPAPAPASASEPGSPKTVSTGWSIPWGLSWLPDGSALLTERDSFKVYTLTQSGTKRQIGEVPNVVTTGGEGGLLSIAVSPSWKNDHYVYVMHTAADGNRIVRMTFDGSALSDYKVLVDGIRKNTYHNGGRIKFGPDGYLYATTGDAQTPDLAQDKTSLNGKILRMTPDGTPAPGNPSDSLVYSYGHRNPQGITWDAEGRLWEGELGDSKYDELNLIEPGKNYGWPDVRGRMLDLRDDRPQAPVARRGSLAQRGRLRRRGDLHGRAARRAAVAHPGHGTSAGTPKAYYTNHYGRLRTVESVPGPGTKSLWLTTTNADNNGDGEAGSDKVFQIDLR